MKLSASFFLSLLGGGLVALIVAFVLAAISVSGVTSMAAAEVFLWISWGILFLALIGAAINKCPGMTGSKSALFVFFLLILAIAGWKARVELTDWLKDKKAQQLAVEKIPLVSPILDIRKPPLVLPTVHSGSAGDVRIRQSGGGNIANPGVIKGSITLGPCSVLQNGGSNNTASPTCYPDPNAPTTIYFCRGNYIIKYPNAAALGAFSPMQDGFMADFISMRDLSSQGRHGELLDACKREIIDHPNWATPFLFCADATYSLGEIEQSIIYLRKYEGKKTDTYDQQGGECPAAVQRLKEALKGRR